MTSNKPRKVKIASPVESNANDPTELAKVWIRSSEGQAAVSDARRKAEEAVEQLDNSGRALSELVLRHYAL